MEIAKIDYDINNTARKYRYSSIYKYRYSKLIITPANKVSGVYKKYLVRLSVRSSVSFSYEGTLEVSISHKDCVQGL